MVFNLDIGTRLKKQGWKVKIHDNERLEDPHVTIYFKLEKWRLSLRSGDFLDRGDKWNQIEDRVQEYIEANWDLLIEEWESIHPDNPIETENEQD